jgi:hypothetical protein
MYPSLKMVLFFVPKKFIYCHNIEFDEKTSFVMLKCTIVYAKKNDNFYDKLRPILQQI